MQQVLRNWDIFEQMGCEKRAYFFRSPRGRVELFLRIKKARSIPLRRSGRVGNQSRQKSLKRAELNAVYLVVCAIETCPNQA
jgi:hypothetical protein